MPPAPEPREVESSPRSPPTSLPVKIGDGGRNCGGSGKNHAVKSYGGQKTLTCRLCAGRVTGAVTDNGPFAETKGAMAGTYVLKARDLGHARALASMTPGTDGEVEV